MLFKNGGVLPGWTEVSHQNFFVSEKYKLREIYKKMSDVYGKSYFS